MEVQNQLVIPIGYVFKPSDNELLIYLVHHILNHPLPRPLCRGEIIKDLDLYGDNSNPWTVLDESTKQEEYWYVITNLKKAGEGQSRIKRRASSGTWKEQHSEDVSLRYNINGRDTIIPGKKRNFVFQPLKGSGYCRATHGHWIMNEYSLNHLNSDCVICQIRNKDDSSKSKKRLFFEDDHNILKKMRIDDHVDEDDGDLWNSLLSFDEPKLSNSTQGDEDDHNLHNLIDDHQQQQLCNFCPGDDQQVPSNSNIMINVADEHDRVNDALQQINHESQQHQVPSSTNMIISTVADHDRVKPVTNEVSSHSDDHPVECQPANANAALPFQANEEYWRNLFSTCEPQADDGLFIDFDLDDINWFTV